MSLIPVVNEQDEIIGYKQRNEILVDDIYRIASLWVINELGEILLVQRATTKSHDPSKWTCTVNGTVEKGENYEENIIKEMEEEIWVKVREDLNPILLTKKLFISSWKHFVAVFFIQLPKSTLFTFDEGEIQATKRVTKEEFEELLEKSPNDFVPSLSKMWRLTEQKMTEMKLV